MVITGGGAMLRHLPQLMKFKTAMDVRIGIPNEHLSGSAKNEINQPMYATSVGLIMRGFEYLETYKKKFNAGKKDEFVNQVTVTPVTEEGPEITAEEKSEPVEEDRLTLSDKIKSMLTKIFEVEDQKIS
jgi:cell division protein FtsA